MSGGTPPDLGVAAVGLLGELSLWGCPPCPPCPPALLCADDERLLVESACGAPLAVLYSGRLQRLQQEGRLRTPLDSVVLVVCGGSNTHTAQLRALKSQLGME